MMMMSIFVVWQESWRKKGYGFSLKFSQDGKDRVCVTHFMFADICYFVSSTRKEFRVMMMEATVELRRRGLEWKKVEMVFMAW